MPLLILTTTGQRHSIRFRTCLKWFAILALVFFAGLNVMAFRHAWAMTHFQDVPAKTRQAETLSRCEKAGVLLAGVKLPRPVNKSTPLDAGMPFDTLRVPGSKDVGIEVWRIPATNSARLKVLVFHGYGAAKASMIPLAGRLHALGCEVWLVDFRGSGGSTGNTTSLGWFEADDVVGACDRANAESPGTRTVLYGGSMGAAAVLRAVSLGRVHPDALILECPFNSMLDTTKNRFQLMGLPSFPLAHVLVFWGGVQQGFNAFAHNPEDYALGVRCPTLLMHGERDARVSMAQARSIASGLGTNGTFKTFPELGHQSYCESAPGEWERTVVDFLSRSNLMPPTH
jgi:alpha-beta hydrolase superfamily lysophospholipase